MAERDLRLIGSQGPSGQLVVRLGDPVLDGYVEFLSGRCRPNTVLAAASDLRVFFAVVDKPPEQVTPGALLSTVAAAQVADHSSSRPRVATSLRVGESAWGCASAACSQHRVGVDLGSARLPVDAQMASGEPGRAEQGLAARTPAELAPADRSLDCPWLGRDQARGDGWHRAADCSAEGSR
jgi:hypothetical protein